MTTQKPTIRSLDPDRASGIEYVIFDCDGVISRTAMYLVNADDVRAIGVDLDQSVKAAYIDLEQLDVIRDDDVVAAFKDFPVAEVKGFETNDGKAVQSALEAGLHCIGLTGRANSAANRSRVTGWKAGDRTTRFYDGVKDKGDFILEQLALQGRLHKVLFISDGDTMAMRMLRVGVAVTVAVVDGEERAKTVAEFVTETKGGAGVLHEVINQLLELRR